MGEPVISQAAIEAAAEALCWWPAGVDDREHQTYDHMATVALTAALPHLIDAESVQWRVHIVNDGAPRGLDIPCRDENDARRTAARFAVDSEVRIERRNLGPWFLAAFNIETTEAKG